jgi:hypothetical protein
MVAGTDLRVDAGAIAEVLALDPECLRPGVVAGR